MHATETKAEKLAQRLSGILARLHRGDKLDKQQLVEEFGVDVRTIERDLVHRLSGIAERNPDGYWQLAQPLRGTVPSSRIGDFARLTGQENIFPDTSLQYVLSQLEIPEHRRTIRVQPMSQVDLGAREPYFAQLQSAIDQRCECRFMYTGKHRRVQPYCLIHKNGVWYLAAAEAESLKSFSLAKIDNLQLDFARHFEPKAEHQDTVRADSDVWFAPETTTVRLRISPAIAHYFTRRPLLPQQSQEPDADGSLLVTARLSHINQLLPIVRYWLPHVRIVQPAAWQEVLVAELSQALTLWGEQTPPAAAPSHGAASADTTPVHTRID